MRSISTRPVLLEDRTLRRKDQHVQHGAWETREMQIRPLAWLQCCVNVNPLVVITVPRCADANSRRRRLKGMYRSLCYCQDSSVSLTLFQNQKLKAQQSDAALRGKAHSSASTAALYRSSGYRKDRTAQAGWSDVQKETRKHESQHRPLPDPHQSGGTRNPGPDGRPSLETKAHLDHDV